MAEIVYSCRDFAVAVKPYGVLSELDAERENMICSVADTLGVAKESIFPVHRLDATTEGLTVYALTKKAAASLSAEVAAGRLHKKYVAYITLPCGFPESGEMRDHLLFDRREQKSYVVSATKKGAKEAVLTYTLAEKADYRDVTVAKAEIELMTGRTHQIRAQFASRHAPLVGDGKYGSRLNYRHPSLFSVGLSFTYDGKEYSFSAPERAQFFF